MTTRPPEDPDDRPVVVHVRRRVKGLLLTVPALKGWVARPTTQHELARALYEALREIEIAAYAAARGAVYDQTHLASTPESEAAARPILHPVERSDGSRIWRESHRPEDWVPLPDGTWRSPSGHIYGRETQAVRRVLAHRAAAGLPSQHPDAPEQLGFDLDLTRDEKD